MLSAFANLFRDEQLKKRMLVTLGILALYRFGCLLPLPFVDMARVKEAFGGEIFQLVNIVSGGALRRGSVFGLGIMPYITSTIIFQLLTGVVPALERLTKEGAKGQEKLRFYQRVGTIVICIVQASIYHGMLARTGSLLEVGVSTWLYCTILFTAGTMLLMWLGDQITEFGVGNGISLIIMAGIVARMPAAVVDLVKNLDLNLANPEPGSLGLGPFVVLLAGFVGVVFGVVAITQGQRRIPMQQAKVTRGSRVYGGQRTYLPLRVNHASVMPIIFASALLVFPMAIFGQVSDRHNVLKAIHEALMPGRFAYTVIYIAMVYFFAYFWTSMTFKPREMADELKEYGSFVPGIRPGARTAAFLETVMVRITFVGATFLALIAVMPQLVGGMFDIRQTNIPQFYGGTAVIIAVGVSLDIMEKLESQLVMRHYTGFLGARGGRIRGRR